MENWTTSLLGDLCEQVMSGGTPLTSVNEYYEGGNIAWLTTKEVNFNRITETEYKITQLGLMSSSAKLIPVNSVILAMYGNGETAGRVAINKIPLATNQACCNFVVNKTKLDYEYLYYFLKSQYKELVNLKTGGAQQNLTSGLIKKFSINHPKSIESQQKIASFLSQFDTKISQNNAQNDTLTALTEAIFRKIYQNTEGVGTFGDLTTQVSTRLGAQADKEKIAVLSAVKTGHLVRTEDYFSKQVFSDDISNYKRVAPLSFAYNPARANIGSMGMNDLNTEGAVSPVYEVFRAKENYHYWVLMLLKHPNIKRGIEGLCSGTVRQNLKYSDLASLNIKIPNEKDIALFNTEYETLRKRYNHNLKQNETLIALRDGLLPKLMTGKLIL